jgi:hypothetical protein
MQTYVDPPAQWKQIYHEVWRIERDFFHDPHYHGLDLAAAEQRFAPSAREATPARYPRIAIGGLHGQWEVENHGVAPDIEVVQGPKLVRQGHDPQLEAGVREALRLLREHPLPTYTHPPFPTTIRSCRRRCNRPLRE